MSSSGTTRVWDLAAPIAAAQGLEILEIEEAGAGRTRVLRVYLDGASEGRSVTVADCELVSRRLGDAIEAHEVVPGHYMLEVSSPGVNRPLRTVEHFRRVLGQSVRLRTRVPREGRRNFIGRLVTVDEAGITIADEAEVASRFELVELEKANLEYRFESPKRPGGRPAKKGSKAGRKAG